MSSSTMRDRLTIAVCQKLPRALDEMKNCRPVFRYYSDKPNEDAIVVKLNLTGTAWAIITLYRHEPYKFLEVDCHPMWSLEVKGGLAASKYPPIFMKSQKFMDLYDVHVHDGRAPNEKSLVNTIMSQLLESTTAEQEMLEEIINVLFSKDLFEDSRVVTRVRIMEPAVQFLGEHLDYVINSTHDKSAWPVTNDFKLRFGNELRYVQPSMEKIWKFAYERPTYSCLFVHPTTSSQVKLLPPIAFLIYQKNSRLNYTIRLFGTDHEFRRQGIMTRMLQHLLTSFSDSRFKVAVPENCGTACRLISKRLKFVYTDTDTEKSISHFNFTHFGNKLTNT